MAISAQSVIKGVSIDVLQDPSNKKWTADQLVRYLNRVQRVIGILKPDAFVSTQDVPLAAGTRQQLPEGYVRMLGVVSNTSGRACTLLANGRALLDAQIPDWRSGKQVSAIEHVMYDPREPLFFEAYPPAASSGASLRLKLQKTITDIAEPGANKTWADVSGDLSTVDDLLGPAHAEGVCWLAYTKDAQHAAQASRATTHAQTMAMLLGVELRALMALAPPPDPPLPDSQGAAA
jgi:hypothetical protein